MNSKRDDDALSWAGDDDPTLAPDAAEPGPPELRDGWSIPGPQSPVKPAANEPAAHTPRATEAAGTDEPAPALGSAALVGMGILAGVYLLYTIGWFIGVGRVETPIADPVSEFMFSLGAWLAVAAPVLWFATTYWLTTERPRLRILWLLIGVVVLVPLPFILGTGVSI